MSEVFIVGVGRSGTSLLQSMLNAHSQITSIPETQFFRKYLASRHLRHRIEKEGVEKFKDRLGVDSNFQRLSIDPSSLRSLNRKELDVVDVYREIIEISKIQKGKSILVDKDPRNLELITEIAKLINRAKFIHIIRDPRDVVNSKTKATWSSNRPYWLHAMIGEAQMKRGINASKTLDQQSYFKLKYEELLEKPEELLKQMCDFIGVDYEADMLKFNESAKELVSESEMQWKKETLQPLMKTNVNKWKKSFTIYQVTLIESLSAWTMRNFNYVRYGDIGELGIFNRIKIQFLRLAEAVFLQLYKILK